MSRALQLLRQNDPQQTEIQIDLNQEEDDAAIAQALEQNQYVTTVVLYLAQRISSLDHLYRVLATHGNLEQIHLVDHTLPSVPVARTRLILQAIRLNASIHGIEFRHNNLGHEDLCSFLEAAKQVTDLTLNWCKLSGGANGAREVAAALQRNTNIVSLKLSGFDGFLVPILEGLGSNTCVRNLVIEHSALSEVTRNAMQSLLESSTTSIQNLELKGIHLWEQCFHPVAEGLINGSSVTKIIFNLCSFCDEGSICLLNQILERKQNLHTLGIKAHSALPQFSQALASALRRPDSPLRHFQFETGELRLEQSLRVLLEAVTESKLESFSIGRAGATYSYLGPLQMVADAIPTMKLRVLMIQFGPLRPMDRARIQQLLRQAVRDNYTLQSVKYQYDYHDGSDVNDAPFIDASEDDETFQFYLQRNIRLAQWVENPATVPKHLWKEATTLATKAGPKMLFRLLRKIGPEVLPVGRKIKREE